MRDDVTLHWRRRIFAYWGEISINSFIPQYIRVPQYVVICIWQGLFRSPYVEKKQAICRFTVATRIPSGKCWRVTPLLYVWTQHFGTLSRFSAENYPNKSPSPSFSLCIFPCCFYFSFWTQLYLSGVSSVLPRQSLECSYVFIFVEHFDYISCPSGHCFEISHHTSNLSFFRIRTDEYVK